MKTWKHIHVKKSTTKLTQPLFGYFYEVDSLNGAKSDIKAAEDCMCLDRLEKALKVRALFKIKKTMEHLLKAEADGIPEAERNNSLYSVDIVSMTQTHMLFVVFKLFRAWSESAEIKCNGIKKNLQNLLRLYALTELQSGDTAANYENGFFAPGTQGILLEASKRLMKELRPQMIPLIEAWEFPDEVLISAIGNSYGDIYETQMEWARNSRLNKTPVPKGFNEYFKPILTGKL
jgi:acyl-CoA oxidase